MKLLVTSVASLAITLSAFGQGQSQILTENFNGTTIPVDWSQATLATDGGWNFGTAAANSSSSFTIPSTGSNIAATNDDDCNCNKSADLLISKPIDLSTATNVHLGFKLFFLHEAYQGAQETAKLKYSTNAGSTWTTVQNIVSGSANWQEMLFDISAAAGNDSVYIGFEYGDGGGWNYGMAIDDVVAYVPYAYDFAATKINLYPVQGLNNAPFTISGEVRNVGSQTITALDINYQIDGAGTIYTTSLTNLNLAPFAVYAFSHPTTWTPAMVGTYNLEVWASNLNSNTDQNASNDKAAKSIQVVASTVQRQVFVEEFTSSTCPPCASFHQAFVPLINNNGPNTPTGKVNVVKYQMNWPSPGTDPNYNQDGQTRRTYYAVSGVPNPFMDANAGYSSQAQIDALYQIPSLLEISGTWSYWNTNANVEVTIVPKANLSGNLKLRIAVVEKEIKVSDFPGYAVTNGETKFEFVMRKMLPNAGGINLGSLTANQSVSHSQSYSFNLGNVTQNTSNIWYGMDELDVVVWVQDDADKTVLQSATLTANGIGVNEFDQVANSLNIYPNPAITQAKIEVDLKNDATVNIQFTNALGQIVLVAEEEMVSGSNTATFDVSNLAPGLYIMNVTINGVSASKRISITR